jgi:hypothetical protein
MLSPASQRYNKALVEATVVGDLGDHLATLTQLLHRVTMRP